MTDLLTREEVRDEELIDDEDGSCIYCECRPLVTLCGRFDDGEPDLGEWDDEEMCPACIEVLNSTGCPNCGCDENTSCRLCEVAP